MDPNNTVGRKQRFNLNKVTAIATTGFAAGAYKLAEQEESNFARCAALASEEVKSWLLMESMPVIDIERR